MLLPLTHIHRHAACFYVFNQKFIAFNLHPALELDSRDIMLKAARLGPSRIHVDVDVDVEVTARAPKALVCEALLSARASTRVVR